MEAYSRQHHVETLIHRAFSHHVDRDDKMMKKTVILSVLCLLVLSATGSAQDTIRITNGEWEPFYQHPMEAFGHLMDSRIDT